MKLTLTDAEGVVIDQWTIEEDGDVFSALLADNMLSRPAKQAIETALGAIIEKEERDQNRIDGYGSV